MKQIDGRQLTFFALILSSLASSVLFCWGCTRTEEHPERIWHDGRTPNGSTRFDAIQSRDDANQAHSMEDVGAFASRMVLLSDSTLPEQTKVYLDLVSNVTERLRWEGDRPIRIEESESEIVIVWPSRHEGISGFRADYEAKAVIDKRTRSVVSLKRGS